MSSHWQSRWALWSHAAEAENTRLNWSRSMYKGAWMIHCPSCICHKKLNLRNFVFNHLWRPRISRTVRKWGRVLWDCRAYACAYACHSFLENIWLWSRFCTHTHRSAKTIREIQFPGCCAWFWPICTVICTENTSLLLRCSGWCYFIPRTLYIPALKQQLIWPDKTELQCPEHRYYLIKIKPVCHTFVPSWHLSTKKSVVCVCLCFGTF